MNKFNILGCLIVLSPLLYFINKCFISEIISKIVAVIIRLKNKKK